MDAQSVPALRHVGGKFVQLVADGERRAIVRHQRGAVGVGHDREWNHSRFVEPRLENGHAGAGDRGVAGGVGRMGGRTFGDAGGQQISAVDGVKVVGRRRVENVGVQRPVDEARASLMDQAAHGFGAEPAGNKPFLIPARFQGAGGHFGHQAQDVWAAEGSKTGLVV